MAIFLLYHDGLLQSRSGRELGIEHLLHLFQGTTTSLDTQEIPDGGIDNVEADKNKVVAKVNGLESDGSNVGVVEIGAVGQNDVLNSLAQIFKGLRIRKLTIPIPLARMGVDKTSAQYVAVRGV